MKIIHCSKCNSVFTPTFFAKYCDCGETYGSTALGIVLYSGNYASVIAMDDFTPSIDSENIKKVSVEEIKLHQKDADMLFVVNVINYLNAACSARYEVGSSNSSTFTSILSRKREFKCSLDDFYQIIDNKVKEWRGTGMEKYLRPATLFNKTKFANYLGQKDAIHRKETKDIGGLINTAESAKRSISEGRRNSGGSGSGNEND